MTSAKEKVTDEDREVQDLAVLKRIKRTAESNEKRAAKLKQQEIFITPHAQRERGKVIGCGVHIILCLWTKKIFESYFRDRLTFSNISSRTSRRIYTLLYHCSLQKCSPR